LGAGNNIQHGLDMGSTKGVEEIILITHELNSATMKQSFSRFPKMVEFTAEVLSQTVSVMSVHDFSLTDRRETDTCIG
jgi:hypothetical protein